MAPQWTTVTRSRLLVLGTLLGLALSACGSGADGRAVADRVQTRSAGGGGACEGEGLIAILLPGSASPDRWKHSDRLLFQRYLRDQGCGDDDFLVQDAGGDPGTQQQQAGQALAQGATVIVLTNLGSASGAAIHQAAARAGAAIVDYDRLTADGRADVYVSFDHEQVGVLQGETLVRCVEEAGIRNPRFAVLNGPADDDDATLVANGYNSVLQEREADGWVRVADRNVPGWDGTQAQAIFDQMLTQAHHDIQAVVAADDGLGNAAITALRGRGLDGQVPVTGHGATAQSLHNIALGDQCMTVYKPTGQAVEAAAEAALTLRRGEQPEAEDTVDNGAALVPSILLEPIAITAENLSQPIDDGYVDIDEVCTGEMARAEFCTRTPGR